MTKATLSPEQLEVLKIQFDLIDQGGNGRISLDEVRQLLQREAYDYLEEHHRQSVIDSFASVDADGDGEIDFEEFVTLFAGTPEDPKAMYRQSFAQYDLDGDGFLTADDFKRISAMQGEDLDPGQAEEMIRMADANEDGKVSFDEYYAIMTQG